jgi:hypothetical protein
VSYATLRKRSTSALPNRWIDRLGFGQIRDLRAITEACAARMTDGLIDAAGKKI